MTFYLSGPCPIAKLSPAVRDMILGSQQLHSIRGDVMTGTTASEVLGMIASFSCGTSV
jgi:hypothetical protein